MTDKRMANKIIWISTLIGLAIALILNIILVILKAKGVTFFIIEAYWTNAFLRIIVITILAFIIGLVLSRFPDIYRKKLNELGPLTITILNLVLWGIFAIINLIFIFLTKHIFTFNIEFIYLVLALFLIPLFIYLFIGLLFDALVYSISKRRRNLALSFRFVFIIVTLIASLLIYLALISIWFIIFIISLLE